MTDEAYDEAASLRAILKDTRHRLTLAMMEIGRVHGSLTAELEMAQRKILSLKLELSQAYEVLNDVRAERDSLEETMMGD
jgi:hypothetical protein